MTKLNQIIAVEKGVKSRSHKTLTEWYQALGKGALFDGQARTYEPKDEDGEKFPAESTRVQKNAQLMVNDVGTLLTELFDITATKDSANCSAKANVVVDGNTLLEAVPATTLLFLEKQLSELHAFMINLPILDPAYDWNLDKNDGLRKTDPIVTAKTRKVTKALVLYPATPEHPAQTDKITEDKITGHWKSVKTSGALPELRKRELLTRVERLQKAVKFAREEANSVVVEDVSIGSKFFDWLLA